MLAGTQEHRRVLASGDTADLSGAISYQVWLESGSTVRQKCGETAEPLRAVRDHLSEIVDRVERYHDRVVITRNGREAAVLLSAADLAELEETLSVLSDPGALAEIREADAAYARGESGSNSARAGRRLVGTIVNRAW